MGNSIANSMASAMAEKQKAAQREVQEEMSRRQMRNMLIGQERMRRVMAAQQVAIARERVPWLGGFWAIFTCGVAALAVKKPQALGAGILPYTAFSLFTAYNWDLGYGTKVRT